MALPVDVSSIDVLLTVREALALFADDGKNALGETDMEVRRCIDWLTHDQRIYWQDEIKKRKEDLSEAKAELYRKQLSQMHGQNAHDSEQRENVREAKHRLEEAEDKLETLRRWVPKLEQAVMEYHGRARSFADMIEFDVVRMIEMMDRMIDALEEYTRLAPPETKPAIAPSMTSTGATMTGAPPPEQVKAPGETAAVEAAKPEGEAVPPIEEAP